MDNWEMTEQLERECKLDTKTKSMRVDRPLGENELECQQLERVMRSQK